ncbi:MAG TPA: hypothetical protein VN554_02870 [Verrucomicrobiae bacterium]|nr:hypothetical protein [Verrucomicrobiae bacterium]
MADKKKPTYAISYGFLGGPAHSRRLRSMLHKQGLLPTRNLQEADIIIAHSAGCWLIPSGSSARLVIFIGMPLAQANRGKAYRQANISNFTNSCKDLKLFSWITGVCLDWYYALIQPRRNWTIIRRSRRAVPSVVPTAAHIFISNRYDPWPKSEQLDKLIRSKEWTFVEFPGSHEDIWRHPERYASIISHYARLLG